MQNLLLFNERHHNYPWGNARSREKLKKKNTRLGDLLMPVQKPHSGLQQIILVDGRKPLNGASCRAH